MKLNIKRTASKRRNKTWGTLKKKKKHSPFNLKELIIF